MAYSAGSKLPPHPQDSLPTPQYFTLKGSLNPAATRVSASVVIPAGELQYSTHWTNCCAGRLRTLAARYGSAPTSLQNCTNSLVPNWLGSYFWSAGCLGSSLAQKLVRRGRLSRGPMPSRQS